MSHRLYEFHKKYLEERHEVHNRTIGARLKDPLDYNYSVGKMHGIEEAQRGLEDQFKKILAGREFNDKTGNGA